MYLVSPGCTVASGPTSTTSPTISWPSTTGYCAPEAVSSRRPALPRSKYPSWQWTSEWHTPEFVTRTSTSEPVSWGFSSSISSAGAPGSA